MADTLERLPEFFSEIQTRMLAGRRAYGDKSFSREPRELLEEVQQELLDVCGWSYVLYCRMARMKDALRDVEPASSVAKGEAGSLPPARAGEHGHGDRLTHTRNQ